VTAPHPVFSGSTAPSLPAHRLLSGQKALVTGANSGIGRGVAIGLAQAGADVMVNYVVGDDAAAAVVEEIRCIGTHAAAYKADVSAEDHHQRARRTLRTGDAVSAAHHARQDRRFRGRNEPGAGGGIGGALGLASSGHPSSQPTLRSHAARPRSIWH
jgi:short chain dehydrogenase